LWFVFFEQALNPIYLFKENSEMEPVETTEIQIPFPEAASLQLRINVGACRLNIEPGEGENWVSGTYQDPTGCVPAKIVQEGDTVRITQEYMGVDWPRLGEAVPRFNLALGKARPYAISLEVGANESVIELGGLPITRLLIKLGAGRAVFDFSTPNPQPMSLLDLDAGAAGLELKNLANANFAEMTVDGGAASYKLDFGGALQQDAHARINAGMAGVEITIPASSPVKITTQTVLGTLNLGDGLMSKDGALWTQAAVDGGSPALTIHASVSLGSLSIFTTA
jgi:hypothetical protein